jgi:acetyl-CoA carboxylase carboxyl transferase subunit beta
MKNLSELVAALRQPRSDRDPSPELLDACLRCGAALAESESYLQARVCHACQYHYTIGARDRIALLADQDSFRERARSLISIDPIAFARAYKRRLFEEERRTGLADAIVTGAATIEGRGVVLAVIDFRFLGGTIGSVVGEKLTRAMEAAARRKHPLIVVVGSAGARIQEGPLALLQTAKIAMARRRLAEARTPFVCVLTTPTLGAAYTGIAALADYLMAEPDALIGYAGARDAGDEPGESADLLLRTGLIDGVVSRAEQRAWLANLLGALTTCVRSRDEDNAPTPRRAPGSDTASAWDHVRTARHQDRPTALDLIGGMTSTYVELRGDRAGHDPDSVTCGIALLAGRAVMMIGQQRAVIRSGRNDDRLLDASAFRKAARAVAVAHRFGLPVLTLIDTLGVDPRGSAAAHGLAFALADCASALAEAPVPTVAAIIGEGSGEGAVAFAICDRVLMLKHATYSVAVPERAAVLLHRDVARAEEMAEALHLTADACRELKVVDVVVPEPEGGAHHDHAATAVMLQSALRRALAELQEIPSRKLLRDRYRRYRAVGAYSGYISTTLAHEAWELRTAIKNKSFAAAARLRPPRKTPGEGGEAEAAGVP